MDEGVKVREKDWSVTPQEGISREVERVNARLRHFRGVAAGVMKDALGIWTEIWELVQDPRSCREILEGEEPAQGRPPWGDTGPLLEKLHLLGIHLEYARKLCEGSIGNESQDEKGQLWPSS